MSEADQKTRAIEAVESAERHLPPFCKIVKATTKWIRDAATGEPKEVAVVYFTFPGATSDGFWRADLSEMAMVAQADYDTYQQLKEQWQQEQRNHGNN